jgi:t-SNARE complex subunit (syntaxin)
MLFRCLERILKILQGRFRELPKINENGVEIFYEFISFDMADKFKKEIEILDKDILKVKEQLNSLENISEQDSIFLNTDIEGMILDLREHLNDLTEKKNDLENTLSKLEQKMQERELEQDKGKQEKSIVKKDISLER